MIFNGYTVTRLHGYAVTRLRGYTVTRLVEVPAEGEDVLPGEVQAFGGLLVAEGAGVAEDSLHELGGALQCVGNRRSVYECLHEREHEIGERDFETGV